MRIILGTVLALAIAYGGYWFVGAHFVERGVEEWFTTQTEAGLVAERDDISVTGFPSRFDITVDAPHIADPQTGWGWRAPFAQGLMLSYKPNHVIVALPDNQVVETPAGEVTVTGQGLRGSIRLGLNLSPVRTAATGQNIRAARGDASLVAQDFRFATQVDDGVVHAVAFQANGIGIKAAGVDLSGGVMNIAAKVTLPAPVADAMPEDIPLSVPVDAVDVTEGVLRFGDIAASVTGNLTADDEGFAAGNLLLRVENWPAALEAAVAAGIIAENQADTLEGGFRMMARGDAVEMPLTLADGVVRFGPLPLAAAPRLK